MIGSQTLEDGRHELAIAGLHLAVLWAFAVAQPLLDLLGDTPEFFVARENTSGDIILLAVVVTLVPPLVLTGLEALVGVRSTRMRRGLHLGLVTVLSATFVLQVIAPLGGGATTLIAVAGLLGVVAAFLYSRFRAPHLLLTVLSPAPAAFVVMFLVLSPVSRLVLPNQEEATAGARVPGEAPVVMIVFDELSGLAMMGPDGHIDEARYPHFARLADDSTWYRNATTVADFTDQALPALLTGERPEPDATPIAADHPESLFTLLGGSYSFDVTEPVTDVCPERLCQSTREPATTRWRELASDLGIVQLHLLLPDDLARDLPAVDRSFEGFGRAGAPGAGAALAAIENRPRRVQDFDAFSRGLSRGPERGRLNFLHVQLPHSPYEFLPSGQRYPKADLPGKTYNSWGDDTWLARQGLQRYLLQLAYTDRLLGEAMARLRSSGRYDTSLIVVVADHGVSFLANAGDRDAGKRNFAPIASVPLLIKAPGQRRGRVDDSNVQTIDLLPTVAAHLGVRLPWSVHGRAAGDRNGPGRVAIRARKAGEISLPFRTFVRRRDLLVRRMAAQFRAGVRGLYAGGPDDDLLGRRVETLGSRSSHVRVAVDDPNGLDAVDPDGPLVPALIGGEVARLSPGARLALAVNGRVVATTIPYRAGGAWSFIAVVAPEAFSRGRNSVELQAATGSGSQRRITRFQTSKTYRLVRENGRATIVNAQGRQFRVTPGAVQGYIDALNVTGPGVTISGWAGTTSPPRAADRIVAFVDGRFLKAARPTGARPDLRSSHGPGLGRAGFRIVSRVDQARRASLDSDLEVFAILNGRATRLSRAPTG